MDPTNILFPPNRFARAEISRRVEPGVEDTYREMDLAALMDAAEQRPGEPAAAAERLAEALLPNMKESHALLTAAARFGERSVKAVERPLKVHATLEWKTAWAAEFVDLHTRLHELTKAHQTMTAAAWKWRGAPGFGDDDRNLMLALNGVARWLEEVKGTLEIAGRSRVGPEGTAV